MIRLKNVFSDGALFQQCARMEVRGWAEPGAALELKLTRGGREIFASRGCADGEGRFALPLETPKGGYDRYGISVSDGATVARSKTCCSASCGWRRASPTWRCR